MCVSLFRDEVVVIAILQALLNPLTADSLESNSLQLKEVP